MATAQPETEFARLPQSGQVNGRDRVIGTHAVVVKDRQEPSRRMPRVQRREQILTAATEAFARSGFAATSLDDIAAEAGITRVVLYRHFASEPDLYQAVLDRMCARLDAHVAEPAAGVDHPRNRALLPPPADCP